MQKQTMGATEMVFTCSIDDGHPLDLKMAELLDKHGLNGTFFLPIKDREGSVVMSPRQARQLGERFEIGSHTYDHSYLRKLDVRSSYFQITEGKRQLEDWLGRPISGFCYPGGRYLKRDVSLVRNCGFKYARTTVNLCLDPGRNPFEMPTTVQFYPHVRGVYLRNFISGGRWRDRSNALWFVMQHRGWMARLHALFDYACEHDRVFHLWGHSRQIDEIGAWHELDAFFSYVGARVGTRNRLTNEQLAEKWFGVDVAEVEVAAQG